MKSVAIQFDRVSKRYGTFKAVDDISFQIPAGAIYGFLGPNGAGKTTCIRMLLEILRPTEGDITVLGNRSALAVRGRIGYLPEEKGLYKKMKTWAIVAFFAALKGVPRRKAKRRAFELLERFGLSEFAEAKTEALSKGMSQKVQMIAAIAHDPELIILDEPFSGLDPVNQQVMEDMIRELAGQGRTVLFSTHVMEHAERLCERLLLLARGRLLFDGTMTDAKQTLPRRVRITTSDDPEPLGRLFGVTALKASGARDRTSSSDATLASCVWELELTEQADLQSILGTAFERGIRLQGFDQITPSLHEVFVHLVSHEIRSSDRSA